MMTHLLDTSVCSQPLKRQPDLTALRLWDQLGAKAATSVVCLAEIEWGLHKMASERRWLEYRNAILPSLHAILPDRTAWSRFASMKARQHALGRPVQDIAVALGDGLALLGNPVDQLCSQSTQLFCIQTGEGFKGYDHVQ